MRKWINLVEGQNDPALDNFMADYEAATAEHPFDWRSRIFNNEATFDVSPFGGVIHLGDIRALNPRNGAGTRALKFLCDLADKHGVTLQGTAKAYDKDRMSTRQLLDWYRKFGFVEDPDSYGSDEDGFDIIRKPKQVLKLGSKTRTVDMEPKPEPTDAQTPIKLRGFKRPH